MLEVFAMNALWLEQQQQMIKDINPIAAEKIKEYQAYLERCLEKGHVDESVRSRLRDEWHGIWHRFLQTSQGSPTPLKMSEEYKHLREGLDKYIKSNQSFFDQAFKECLSQYRVSLKVPQQFSYALHQLYASEQRYKKLESILGERRKGLDFIANNIDSIVGWYVMDESSEQKIHNFLNEICQFFLANNWVVQVIQQAKGKHERARIEAIVKEIKKSAKSILWDLYEIKETNKFQDWLAIQPPLDHPEEPEIDAILEKALEQSAQGKGQYLVSFAKYADIEVD
jgi:hypothetical protein